ncbi:trypsin-like serine protease [Kitasatospora sp. NPDC090091]|uniref:VMAP-C domain-containing protein n=1 Tax=Kitasatospora sp. NPDC090091 TaxID=3364081 RepID=UPI0037FE2BBC
MDPRRLALIRSGTAQQSLGLGSGYLIAPRLVLTARHVVVDRGTGTHRPEIRVRVGHPRDGGIRRARADRVWTHPSLDVALLLLDEDMGVPGAVRWGRPVGRAPLPYEGLGFPQLASADEEREVEHLRGVLPPLSSGSRDHYVLDQEPAPDPRSDRRKPWAGASGAAVFCGDHLVGVVIQDDQSYGTRRLRACPARSFVQDGPFAAVLAEYADGSPCLAEIGGALPAERSPSEYTRWEEEIAQALWRWLGRPDTCAAHTRALAAQLGYPVPADRPPSIGVLMTLLGAHPRALASLSGTLVDTLDSQDERDRLAGLLTRARTLEGDRLLSLTEYERLLDLLRAICKVHPTVLPRAAREALRYALLPEALARPGLAVDDLDEVVRALEEIPDSGRAPEGTPPVPALLRVVEYVAAVLGSADGDELRRWSTGVAHRTGIHPTALNERRTDACQWADRPASPVARVVLELTGAPGTAGAPDTADERYHCRILLARQDGTRTVLHEPETAPKTPEDVARCLRDAVESAAAESGQGPGVPWVTVLVDRPGLHLAVDEWNPGAPNVILPGRPIGAEYRLTLSCPEISEIAATRDLDQRRRWDAGPSAPLTTDQGNTTAGQLVQLLRTTHRDTAQVVLHGPREGRTPLLEICLALGVPIVLWDRGATCFEDAAKLQRLDPVGPLADLPERVRVFRGETFLLPGPDPALPSLVWEEGSRYPKPESLQLMDPRKGAHV